MNATVSRFCLLFLFAAFSGNAFAQFPSTSSYALIYEVPKAKNIGDTVFASNAVQTYRTDAYQLLSIDKSGTYAYKRISGHSSLRLEVTYDENNRVQSYAYQYKEYGGEDKGFFMIHYYPNGNIKDYIDISFYALNQPCEAVLYDSLSYVEKDRAKIPSNDYDTFQKRGKVYLSEKYLENKEWKRKIRKKAYTPVQLIDNFPFKTYLIN